jgi:hypothetical protein
MSTAQDVGEVGGRLGHRSIELRLPLTKHYADAVVVTVGDNRGYGPAVFIPTYP